MTTKDQWDQDVRNIDSAIKNMVETMVAEKVEPVAITAIDSVLRIFMRWIHAAQFGDQEPEIVKKSMINLISLMIMEMALRVNRRDDINGGVSWINEFIIELGQELQHDVDSNFAVRPNLIVHNGGKLQ